MNPVFKEIQLCDINRSSCKENVSSCVEPVHVNSKDTESNLSPEIHNSSVNLKKSPFKFPGLDLPSTHPDSKYYQSL